MHFQKISALSKTNITGDRRSGSPSPMTESIRGDMVRAIRGLSCYDHRKKPPYGIPSPFADFPGFGQCRTDRAAFPFSRCGAVLAFVKGVSPMWGKEGKFLRYPMVLKKIEIKKMQCFWIDGCRKMGWLLARRVLSGVRAWGPPPLYHMNVTGIWWPIVGAK